HLAREHDRARARAEDGTAARSEGAELPLPRLSLEELPQGRRLAAGDHEPLGARKVPRALRLEAVDADLGERLPVRLEVALQGENGDSPASGRPFRPSASRYAHHPRVWS